MTEAMVVATAWRRIEQWYAASVPTYLEGLNPPATASAIAAAEAALGRPLPAAWRASLAIHDGQDGGANEAFGDWGLDDLAAIVDAYAQYEAMRAKQEPGDDEAFGTFSRGPVRPHTWNAAWIPFATNGGGTYLAIDLDPAPGGTVGQIIRFSFKDDLRQVVATGLGAWLTRAADRFESGYYVDGGCGTMMRRDDVDPDDDDDTDDLGKPPDDDDDA